MLCIETYKLCHTVRFTPIYWRLRCYTETVVYFRLVSECYTQSVMICYMTLLLYMLCCKIRHLLYDI